MAKLHAKYRRIKFKKWINVAICAVFGIMLCEDVSLS